MTEQEMMEYAQRALGLMNEAKILIRQAPEEFVKWAWDRYYVSSPDSDDEEFFDRLTDLFDELG